MLPSEIPSDLTKLLSEVKKTYENIRPKIEWAIGIYKNMHPQIEQALLYLEELKKSEVINSTLQILQQQKEFQKSADCFARIIQEKMLKNEVMLQSGWWFTPSLLKNLPASQISEPLRAYSEGDKGAITRLFMTVYHRNEFQYLDYTVGGWSKNKLFAPWMKIIKDALEAHREKKYSLSVPALLLSSEGIATDYCKRKGIFAAKMRSNGGKKIKAAIDRKQKIDPSLKIFALDLLFEAIDNRLYQHTNKLRKPRASYRHFLNRHAVLHGLTHTYDSPKNSLQCFMLLDVLSLL